MKVMAANIVRILLLIGILLVIAAYFLFRGPEWPVGTQALESLSAAVTLLVTLALFLMFTKRAQPGSLQFGLLVGLLWTVEIAMNNVLMPPLPERDLYDNLFWAAIALLLLWHAGVTALRRRSAASGILAGLWAGFASGAVACATGLILVVFGMPLLLSDTVNQGEWLGQGHALGDPAMAVYFAYQTLAGALLHLVVLGIGMGLAVGLVGGALGKAGALSKRLTASTPHL